MFPLTNQFKKVINISSGPQENYDIFKVVEHELQYENYNSIRELKIEQNELTFQINYKKIFGRGFMSLIRKGNFSIMDDTVNKKIIYLYFIGIGLHLMSFLVAAIAFIATSFLDKSILELIVKAAEFYLISFFGMWIITLISQKLFFERVCNKIRNNLNLNLNLKK